MDFFAVRSVSTRPFLGMMPTRARRSLSLAYNLSGDRLAAGFCDLNGYDVLRLFDTGSVEVLCATPFECGAFICLAYSPSNDRLDVDLIRGYLLNRTAIYTSDVSSARPNSVPM